MQRGPGVLANVSYMYYQIRQTHKHIPYTNKFINTQLNKHTAKCIHTQCEYTQALKHTLSHTTNTNFMLHTYEGGLILVHRQTMMQWLNLTKCGLFFNIASPAVHTLLPSVLQCLDSGGIEALILILEKVLNCRYDFIICLILLLSQVFFYVGEQKIVRWCQIRRIWQPLQPQTCVQDHCPGETGLALSVFQAIFAIFPRYYFSKSWITYPVWV